MIYNLVMFINEINKYNLIEKESTKLKAENIELTYLLNDNERLIIKLNKRNNNNDNDLLIICDTESKRTTEYINSTTSNNKIPKIIELILKIMNKNNYNNSYLMNMNTLNLLINISLIKKLLESKPDINIIIAVGGKMNNYKDMINELHKLFELFYINNLVRCFWTLKNGLPCLITQRNNTIKKIEDIIENKYFNEYPKYNFKN